MKIHTIHDGDNNTEVTVSNAEIEMKPRERSTALAWSKQKARRDTDKYEHTPWWRLPPLGYIATFPLVGLALLIPFWFQHVKIYQAFLDTPLVLVTLIIALIWGTQPAVLSILLGTAAFDIYFLSDKPQLFQGWNESLPLVPFVLAQIVMVVLAAQREKGRLSIEAAQKELKKYAEQLEWVNRQLQEANKLKDQFLSMASHELKTPITTIRGQAQLGIMRLNRQTELSPELEQVRTAFERIEQHTYRLNGLVDDLLDLSTLSSGKVKLRASQCDLGEACREIIDEQHALSGREIVLELPPVPVLVQADCERIGQVITNLVSNAVKYSTENSTIQVSVSQSQGKAIVRVHNQGKPIPKELQTNLFEPFYRTPDAQSSSKKGWGLGLAISKQIVERHGGRIRVESSQGKGTTFTIELPPQVDKTTKPIEEVQAAQ
jgi:signal transduction histidine kinase